MRLLLLDQFSDLGGAQQALLDLLPAIRERGWQATVGLPGEGELVDRVRALGFDVERIPCGPYASGHKSLADLGRFVAETPRLARQIRRTEAGLVYINGPRILPAAALARLDVPVVFHSHSYLFPGPVRRLAAESLRRMNAHVIANCEFTAGPWRPFAPVTVIYNGVGGVGLRPAQIASQPLIGCIGRIAPEKGQLAFLQAAALIHRSLPQTRFLIQGAALFGADRYEREVRTAATNLPVEFAGWTTDIYSALAKLDLLLVPSAGHEATTRVILEAFAAGVPVIAFRSGGIPEVVGHGVNGFLATTAEEMAQLAIELLKDAPRCAALAQAARETWSRRFTLDRYRRDVLDALARACETTPRPPTPALPRR